MTNKWKELSKAQRAAPRLAKRATEGECSRETPTLQRVSEAGAELGITQGVHSPPHFQWQKQAFVFVWRCGLESTGFRSFPGEGLPQPSPLTISYPTCTSPIGKVPTQSSCRSSPLIKLRDESEGNKWAVLLALIQFHISPECHSLTVNLGSRNGLFSLSQVGNFNQALPNCLPPPPQGAPQLQ